MRKHVYFYTYVEPSLQDVAPVLDGDPGVWLPLPAEPVDEGWRVRLHAEGALPPSLSGHDAMVRVGPGDSDPEAGLLRRVAWQSASADRLVPVLEGDLEVVSSNGFGCKVSLMGSYRPPMSVIGEAGDRLFGHRVAEACVRRFVLDVAERLRVATLQV